MYIYSHIDIIIIIIELVSQLMHTVMSCFYVYTLSSIHLSLSLLSVSLSLFVFVSLSLSLGCFGSEHRFLAVGIGFRWREIALLAAVLGPLAYLAAVLGHLAFPAASLGPLACLAKRSAP